MRKLRDSKDLHIPLVSFTTSMHPNIFNTLIFIARPFASY